LNDGRVFITGDSYTFPYNATEVYVPSMTALRTSLEASMRAREIKRFKLDDGRVLLAGGTVAGSYDPAVNSEIFTGHRLIHRPAGSQPQPLLLWWRDVADGRVSWPAETSAASKPLICFSPIRKPLPQ